jgi:hypothetical protein
MGTEKIGAGIVVVVADEADNMIATSLRHGQVLLWHQQELSRRII